MILDFAHIPFRGRFFKGKKNAGPTPSSLEMYWNHQVRTHASNGQPGLSSTSSPPQPGLPNTYSGSADNQAKVATPSVDVNNKVSLENSLPGCLWLRHTQLACDIQLLTGRLIIALDKLILISFDYCQPFESGDIFLST